MSRRQFNMIDWKNLFNHIKTESLRGQVKALRRDAYRFLEAWEAWTFKYDCVLQANDGCDKCNLEDWNLDWCPFHPSSQSETK